MQKWAEQEYDGYHLITQKKGATLGYSPKSGIKIIYVDGYAFKDLNRDGKLDVYEDWRQPVEKRVDDLVSKLSIENVIFAINKIYHHLCYLKELWLQFLQCLLVQAMHRGTRLTLYPNR